MPRGSSVAGPFVTDQPDAARLCVLNPTMIKESGLWRPPLHQNRNAIWLASIGNPERAFIFYCNGAISHIHMARGVI